MEVGRPGNGLQKAGHGHRHRLVAPQSRHLEGFPDGIGVSKVLLGHPRGENGGIGALECRLCRALLCRKRKDLEEGRLGYENLIFVKVARFVADHPVGGKKWSNRE